MAALVDFGLSGVKRGSPPTLKEEEAESLAPGSARFPAKVMVEGWFLVDVDSVVDGFAVPVASSGSRAECLPL